MGNRLYVGNLSFDTTEDTLRAAFSEDGRTVTEVNFATDHRTNKPRGFGFVDMASEEDAQAVITAMDGVTLDGRELKVNRAKERKPAIAAERKERY
ncbi:MAG: cold-inducible RNA-binding protein [Candidatus Paceibacteria bacterium]|jgi:cold-inducible RNA-binding protein